jgi:hypothetical protein
MKKYFLGALTGFIACTMLVSTMAIANSPIKLIVNGAEVFSDVPPQIIDGRTMIPARPLAEALGAKVEWDAKNSAVVVTGGIQVGATPIDLEPVCENVKGDETVGNVVVDKTIGVQKYEKDGYTFLIKDGIEYYPTGWINAKIYEKKYIVGYNKEKQEVFISHNKYPGMPTSKMETVLENIPYEVFENLPYPYIKKEHYDNMILPIIK